MRVQISTSKGGLLPEGGSVVEQKELPGLRSFQISGSFGKLVFNRCKANSITVWSTQLSGEAVDEIQIIHNKSFLGVHASLEASFVLAAEDLPEFKVKQHECAVAYLKNIAASFIVQNHNQGSSVHIRYPLYFFRMLVEHFPLFGILIHHAENNQSHVLSDRTVYMDLKMLGIIDDMLANDYPFEFRKEYINFKAVDLLFAVTKQLARNAVSKSRYKLTQSDLQNLYQLPAWLEAHLDEQLSIKRIAKRLAMNPAKFNRAFKDLFGINIHKFILTLRARKGYLLVTTTTKSLQEIAIICGFSTASHFTEVFKKYFGKTPKEYRN